MASLFSDFLSALQVRHTEGYSDARYHGMPFKTLFGLSRLLGEYHIESRGIRVADKSVVTRIPTPFIAQMRTGMAIVDSISGDKVSYRLRGGSRERSVSDFCDRWSGVALLAYPGADSSEPDYANHEFHLIAEKGKRWVLLACVLLLGVFGFIYAGFGHHLSQIFLLATDLAGVYICWLLMLKSVNVRSRAADRVCGVLQEHGCDHVLEQKASTFFGIFGWAEVGLAYFSVSTLLMFLFPELTHWLALVNGCCLPFTVWSISYQKFVIKTWCTLCVTVQGLLWLQFFCYLFGGWWHDIFPLRIPLFLMIAAYIAVMLGINAVKEFVLRRGAGRG